MCVYIYIYTCIHTHYILYGISTRPEPKSRFVDSGFLEDSHRFHIAINICICIYIYIYAYIYIYILLLVILFSFIIISSSRSNIIITVVVYYYYYYHYYKLLDHYAMLSLCDLACPSSVKPITLIDFML